MLRYGFYMLQNIQDTSEYWIVLYNTVATHDSNTNTRTRRAHFLHQACYMLCGDCGHGHGCSQLQLRRDDHVHVYSPAPQYANASRRGCCRWPGGRPGAETPENSITENERKLCSNARQKNRRGAAPKHRGGENNTGGNSPQGNPTRQHPPHRESSTRRGPRCKTGRGGRRSSDFRVKQRAPPTAGSCSHRVAEKLYSGKEDPWTSA